MRLTAAEPRRDVRKPRGPRWSRVGVPSSRLPRLQAGRDALSAWAPAVVQPATPGGTPTLTHCPHAPRPRPASRIPARWPRPEPALTRPPRPPARTPGPDRSGRGRERPRAGRPSRPPFSGLRTSRPARARSSSGRVLSSSRRRGGTLSVCARRGLYLHPKQNNYTFVGGRKPVIRRGLFAAKQFLSGTPV